MFTESFHRVLKIVYLQHKQNRRVDYLLYILLKISKDKAFEQLCKLEKGKATHCICDINKRHKTALTSSSSAIITENLQENSYRVTSQTRPGFTYNITVDLSECKCKLKCRFAMHVHTCTHAHAYMHVLIPQCVNMSA